MATGHPQVPYQWSVVPPPELEVPLPVPLLELDAVPPELDPAAPELEEAAPELEDAAPELEDAAPPEEPPPDDVDEPPEASWVLSVGMDVDPPHPAAVRRQTPTVANAKAEGEAKTRSMGLLEG